MEVRTSCKSHPYLKFKPINGRKLDTFYKVTEDEEHNDNSSVESHIDNRKISGQ